MAFDVSIVAIFVAGLLSFLSPCVLPLVPPYLCYLAGIGVNEVRDGADRSVQLHLVRTAIVFVLGFSTVFVILGATASAIGQLMSEYLDVLTIVAGVLIIMMGMHFLGVFRITALMRELRFGAASKPTGAVGAYIMGLAFAFGWTPCVGPVLATVLFAAGAEETAVKGAGLLLVYALGIGIPFVAVAVFIGPAIRAMSNAGRLMGHVERVMGVLLIVTGILFVTGKMSDMAYWLLEAFPSLGQVG